MALTIEHMFIYGVDPSATLWRSMEMARHEEPKMAARTAERNGVHEEGMFLSLPARGSEDRCSKLLGWGPRQSPGDPAIYNVS